MFGNRKKAIEELKKGISYEVAIQIKDEIAKKGYEVDDNLSTDFCSGEVVGSFRIRSKEKETKEAGTIYFCMRSRGLIDIRARYQIWNASGRPYRYMIDNANINLLVCSDEKSLNPPLFLEIAAEVLKRGDFVFKHPDYIDESNARDYLNVGLLEG